MDGFSKLDARVQRWIWDQGWTTMRDAQERAIPALVEADRDVIIAAQTAAGKTEAAFFPILTHLLRTPEDMPCVLYVSPIKALINNQFERLTDLCLSLEIPVVPWHGDVSPSKKHKFLRDPRGILLITPESLEALFVTRGASVRALFGRLVYFVVDELHYFIATERGKQLQSLMHRSEIVAGHDVVRVGLSATLGDMNLAAQYLRPNAAQDVCVIVSESTGQNLKILVKGYVEVPLSGQSSAEQKHIGCDLSIATHIYKSTRDTNNLIFPNSRTKVESYSDLLRRLCEADGLPNQYWPHHGSLSKEIREEVERALKAGDNPASAICTSTLELGVDIGGVKNVVQIGPPPSVASLRQRLGRSGRRDGEPAILRGYNIEQQVGQRSGLSVRVRESLLESVAMINLLLQGWYEPPRPAGLHASTLVQQILSMIAERGGLKAGQLWQILVATGPFSNISHDDFVALLRSLGEKELIVQESSGLLLHGPLGERLVNNYEFYSAFRSDDEYSIENNGKVLGTTPISIPLIPGQGLIFAGRRWRVTSVDETAFRVLVSADKGGVAPNFDGARPMLHDRVRAEMKRVVTCSDEVRFLDAPAHDLLQEARGYASEMEFACRSIVQVDGRIALMTWRGDWVNNALQILLAQYEIESTNEGILLSVDASVQTLVAALASIRDAGVPDVVDLLQESRNIAVEKWDWALPKHVLSRSYASSNLDFEGAIGAAIDILSRKISAAA